MVGDSLHSMVVIIEIPIIGSTESVVGDIMLNQSLVNMVDNADEVTKVLLTNCLCPLLCKPVSDSNVSIVESVYSQHGVLSSDNSHVSLVDNPTYTTVDSEGCLDEAGQQSAN